MTVRTFAELPSLRRSYLKVLRQPLPVVGSAGDPTGPVPELRCDGVRIDPSRLGAYQKVCGFESSSSAVPVTYPQVLTFPLQLELLTDPGFPFTALGAVHVANTIRLSGELDVDAPIDIDMRGTEPRPHRRGRQLEVVTEVHQHDQLVWTSEATVLQLQSAEQSSAHDAGTPDEDVRASDVPDEPPAGPQVWRLPSGLGRQYAGVSGDRNPIHLFDLTAIPFGFRHHIAHGMWTKARCLAELGNRLPATYAVHVAFRKPVPLPGSVRFGARTVEDHIDFGLSTPNGDSAYLLGRVVAT